MFLFGLVLNHFGGNSGERKEQPVSHGSCSDYIRGGEGVLFFCLCQVIPPWTTHRFGDTTLFLNLFLIAAPPTCGTLHGSGVGYTTKISHLHLVSSITDLQQSLRRYIFSVEMYNEDSCHILVPLLHKLSSLVLIPHASSALRTQRGSMPVVSECVDHAGNKNPT